MQLYVEPRWRGNPRDPAAEWGSGAYSAALVQLAASAACCGGQAIVPVPTSGPPTRSSSRGRHEWEVKTGRFVLPWVTVVEPGASRESRDVLVAGGRIVDVVAPGSGPYEGYAVLEEYRGHYVTPALVDMHMHLPPHNVLSLVGLVLSLHLVHGVTTVREAGDLDGTALPEALDGLSTGRFRGPRVLPSGPFVTKGRARWKNSLFVNGPEDAERIARELVARGSSCMKIYENLAPEDIAALERAAKARGLSTLGHVPTRLGFEEAPLADAQHFFGVPPPASLPRDHVLDRTSEWDAVDDARMDVIVRASVEGRRAHTPTLIVTERLFTAGASGRIPGAGRHLLPRYFESVIWHPRRGLPAYRGPTAERAEKIRRALEKKLTLVGRLHRAGAVLRLGTDLQPFVVPGDALHREMKLFERAGVPASAILGMATRDAALALNRPDLGTIRREATADLLVCSQDPSVDLGALGAIRAIVHGGALQTHEAVWSAIQADLAARDGAFGRIAGAVFARLGVFRATRNFVG